MKKNGSLLALKTDQEFLSRANHLSIEFCEIN